ncbi:MAG: deoxynucleoside kinase [Flavobacteriales bacterium]|nr:deoxynucleoside kinase [Flavobacteriales bacterium]
MHIAIAGNIGSGKTTLTQLLAKHYKWDQLQEAVDNNPYLFDFYKDMQRWSFNLQIFFLNSRYEQLIDIRRSGRNVIQDRTIYEDAFIFAPNLHAMGLMTTRDFENYFRLFQNMDHSITPPDLMIYLQAPVDKLVKQISERGRDYENSISIDYLKRLNERYEAWIQTYDKGKLLIIDVEDNSFHKDPEDLGKIISRIDAEIHGLFPMETASPKPEVKVINVGKPAPSNGKAASKPAGKAVKKAALAKPPKNGGKKPLVKAASDPKNKKAAGKKR